MVARNDKGSVRYRQFEGGYAQAVDTQLKAILNAMGTELAPTFRIPLSAATAERISKCHLGSLCRMDETPQRLMQGRWTRGAFACS